MSIPACRRPPWIRSRPARPSPLQDPEAARLGRATRSRPFPDSWWCRSLPCLGIRMSPRSGAPPHRIPGCRFSRTRRRPRFRPFRNPVWYHWHWRLGPPSPSVHDFARGGSRPDAVPSRGSGSAPVPDPRTASRRRFPAAIGPFAGPGKRTCPFRKPVRTCAPRDVGRLPRDGDVPRAGGPIG